MNLWKTTKQWFTKGFKQEVNFKQGNWVGPTFNFQGWATDINEGVQNNTLSTNEEIFSVITRLANTVSSLPIHLYKNYEEVDDGIAELVRSEANPSMSAFSLINQLEVSRNSSGNGYVFIERDVSTGVPIRLWPIDPTTVTIKRNIDDNSIYYEVTSSDPNYHFLVFNTEMIHVRHITPLTGVLGISPIDVLRGPLQFEKAVEDFSVGEMNKKDQYIIKYDRSVSPENRKAVIEDFTRMIKENGGAVVQEKGFDYDRFASNFQPSDLKTSEQITRSRIANAFNIPIAFLNELNGTASMNEQAMIQFVQMTLVPIVKQYESEFNRKLLTQSQRTSGFYFKFNVNGLMRGDTASRTNFYQMMIRNGIATQNDLRKLEDMTPITDKSADITWISKDLFPSESQMKASVQDIKTAEKSSKGGDSDEQDGTTKVPDDQTGK
ncbi:phage portal protein [Limosilactobacillus reuteri]|uniref:Phage portal protein, HK97 family n=2 Tax=Limosilactobacillus reuteri TaxID=1598 RepID=B3XQ45_LIMR1|nr:phage portal protein [Limosilactobacillus reuteri]EDX41646.1 phage portal protein, HK97 family [Limosilactobacillus reuteri subsp. rodentium]MCC4475337.1 phage portal protein [Limosilactobacillus reuteri]MCC4477390.1 phage portal protein [Limosilactobacillus reuteri]MCC4479667.1 phage portal protein [Limosilactobacillus reuteri]MCC4489027.1 phage portal protein [Limosilactobacillus reuteri]